MKAKNSEPVHHHLDSLLQPVSDLPLPFNKGTSLYSISLALLSVSSNNANFNVLKSHGFFLCVGTQIIQTAFVLMPAMSLDVHVSCIAAPLSLPPPLTRAHPAHSYPPLLSLKSLSSKTHLISQQHIQRARVPLNFQLPFLLHYHLTSSRLHLTLILHLSTHGEGISLQTSRLVYLMLM